MNKKIIFFILISCCIFSCRDNISKRTHPEAINGTIDLTNWNPNTEKPIKIKGEWEFYWLQLLTGNDFNNPLSPEKTGNMKLPGIWNGYLVNGEKIQGTGYCTYKLRVIHNDNVDTLAFRFHAIQTSCKIFINEKVVGSAGIPGTNNNNTTPEYRPQYITYKPEGNSFDIIIQVSNFDHRQGGVWGSIEIGSGKDINRNWRYNRDQTFFIVGAIIIIGLYHLGVSLIRKKKRDIFFFSIYCFVIALRILATGEIAILDIIPNLPWKILIIIEYLTFFSAIPLVTLFIYYIFEDKPLKVLTKILIVISSLCSIITIITPVSICSWVIPGFQIITINAGVYILYILVKNSVKKDTLAIFMLTGFLLMFLTVINDILYAADIIHSIYMISYGILFFIFFQAVVMTINLSRSFKEVERQRKQLLNTNAAYRYEIRERVKLEKDLHLSYQKNSKTRTAIIMGLAKLAEYRDTDTGSHLERIQEYNSILAGKLKEHPSYIGYISKEYIEDLHLSSILHDIGKVGIPDAILQKPGKLTSKEFEIMKKHSTIGGDSIKTVELKTEVQSFLTLGKEIAFMHHERWDGKGYPTGIEGNAIPLSARLTALVDVYDALTSKRCYKDAFSHEKAVSIIIESKGSQFDPDIVDAFIQVQNQFDLIRRTLQDKDESEIDKI